MQALTEAVSNLRVVPKTEGLKAELTKYLEKEILFRSLNQQLMVQIVNAMFKVEVTSGKSIIRQGDTGDNMYICVAGHFDCFIEKDGEKEKVMDYSKGSSFGELALLYNSPRAASVVATEDSVLWALDRESFNFTVVANSSESHHASMARKVSLLKPMKEKMLHDMLHFAKSKEFNGPSSSGQPGQLILRKGQSCDALFIIVQGEVAMKSGLVAHDGGSSEHVIRTLGPGSCFGGLECITGRHTTAEFHASKASSLLMIPKNRIEGDVLKPTLDFEERLGLLTVVPSFKNFSMPQLREVAEKTEMVEMAAGTSLTEKGKVAGGFHVLAEGSLSVGGKKVGTPGASTGSSIFSARAEDSDITVEGAATKIVRLATKDASNFMAIMEKAQMVQTLKGVKILEGLTGTEMSQLANSMESSTFRAGETLIKQGDRGEKFFVLCKGEVAILKRASDNSPEIELMRMTEGCFGERALMNDEPRAASVKATTDGHVYVIDRVNFEKHLGSLKELMQLHTQELERFQMNRLIKYEDLVPVRTIGVGSFGRVRMVQHKPSGNVYALKSLSKKLIIQYKQQQHLRNEKLLMEKITHPLCVRLVKSFKDMAYVHILLEFSQGGELFRLMDEQPNGCFSEYATKFYSACVVLVLEHLHEKGIVYRDIKPENLLLDKDGYIKMVDFGFAKQISGPTYTICGTPDYIAPEIITRKGHQFAADYWALGVLTYEMLTGEPPFSTPDTPEKTIYSNIIEGRYTMQQWMSPLVKDFIANLLALDPAQRLGSGPKGVKAIRNHPWFAEIDWIKLERKKLPPPIPIKVKNHLDISNFDVYTEEHVNAPPVNDTTGWDSCF